MGFKKNPASPSPLESLTGHEGVDNFKQVGGRQNMVPSPVVQSGSIGSSDENDRVQNKRPLTGRVAGGVNAPVRNQGTGSAPR